MQVSLAVFGRFRAFEMAQQLSARAALKQLITTYPAWAARRVGVPGLQIQSLVHLEVLSRLGRSLTLPNLHPLWLRWFDREVTGLLLPSDVFVGWSGACLQSLTRARTLGAKTILERGSSHIAYQNQLLAEEGEIWGVSLPQTHPIIWERELQGYELCDRICVPSRFAQQTFLDAGFPASKILYLPLGTSRKEFYPVPKEDDIFRIVHAGILNLRKGIPYLLQAFFELKLPKAELWLLGSLEPEILPFLQKYACDAIVWQGKQPQSRLRWFYSQCSVFALVSIEDGFGVVIPQAMACGLPVIHTPHTGGPDIVRENIDGFCVPIRDVAALKEKILFFYENPDALHEMSHNACHQAQTALSWENYGERAIAAYQSLLG